jgi:glycosyltransferase involved in cell wall biosynthesis
MIQKSSGKLFSIIIPTLNEEKFLPHLLESLACQSYRDFEVIVSDGNSKDHTILRAKSFEKRVPKLTIVKNTQANLPMQRNSGAREATGEWLFFIDADSVLFPYSFERIAEFITLYHPAHFTPWYAPDSRKVKDALLILLVFNAAIEGSVMMKRPVAFGPFSAIRRDAFDRVGGYNESLGYGEDNDISRRIHEAGYICDVIRETLVIYSFRRMRKYGTMKMLRFYSRGALSFMLTKKTPKNEPTYLMGGHIYTKQHE